MKRHLILITALLLSAAMHAQTNAIDELFNKYSESEGFTFVSISGRMLSLFGTLKKENSPDNILLRLTSIRILSQEELSQGAGVNFFEEVSRRSLSAFYDELMVVREGSDETMFLVKQNGDKISELLVISGGSGGNSIISIKGDINLKELSELSETIGIEELEELEGYEGKQPPR
jgi:hypothetical protein